jgi:hypothetical protein
MSGGFDDFDLEYQNNKESDAEMFITTVALAGSPQIVTPSNGRPIQQAILKVERIGPNSGTNSFGDFILYSTDGGSTFHTLRTNDYIALPGVFADLQIDASKNGMVVEVEVRS